MQDLFERASKYLARARRRRLWMRAVSILACVVILGTTYAQILTAVTMETSVFEPDGHVHTEECYKTVKTEEKRELDCPLELHTHTAGCYDADGELTCGYADFVVHTHDSNCYDENGRLVCTLPEIEEHTHTAQCWPLAEDETFGTLAAAPHVHTEDCYTVSAGELICGQEETDGHTHDESCYIETEKLACGLEEEPPHTHDDACYDLDGELMIEHEETEGHTHDASCYETVKELACELEETEPHHHTDECYAQEKELTCGLGEETEAAAPSVSFDAPEEQQEPLCGLEEVELHTHTAACYGADGSLVCGQLEVKEHQHTEECFRVVQEASEEKVLDCPYTASDETEKDGEDTEKEPAEDGTGDKTDSETEDETGDKADGETEDGTGDKTGGETEDKTDNETKDETGDKTDNETKDEAGDKTDDKTEGEIPEPAGPSAAEKLLEEAQSQIGYAESADLYIEEEGERRGYTVYGEYYGLPYEKWDAMFVAYCMEKAGVENIPSAAECLFDIDLWAAMLAGKGCYQAAGFYAPAPGNLAFFDLDADGTLDHVAVVEKATDTRLSVIAGDTSDCVRRVSYDAQDLRIAGFGVVASGDKANPEEPDDADGEDEPKEDETDEDEPDEGESGEDEPDESKPGEDETNKDEPDGDETEKDESEEEASAKTEQEQVKAVAALLDALPSQEEIEETLTELDAIGDEDGYNAYLAGVVAQAKRAYEAYSNLTPEQKEQVANADKLMALEPLWSAEALEEEGGKVEPILNGDFAYLVNAQMKADSTTVSKYAVRTGTAPFDTTAGAGNDTTDLDNDLRTFDTASFTIQFSTTLRESVRLQNIAGYETGRIYFEFILPASSTQAQFELNAMGWLESSQGIAFEVEEESNRQILHGSYMLVANDTNPAAIGASTNELSIVIRALQMQNGQKLQPTFTLWLDYNDVGVSVDETTHIPQSIVTGTEYNCAEHEEKEFVTITGPEITISATPRYNIQLVKGDVRTVKVDTYDFNATSNTDAINYGIGTREGRLMGYGILVEIRGGTGQGMRGVELPSTKDPITFDIEFSSTYQGKTQEAYQPLFWSGGANKSGNNNADGREVNTSSTYILSVPNNQRGTAYSSCLNGGTWTFTDGGEGKVNVKIENFVMGTSVGSFPYGVPSGSSLSYTYYNPNNVENYWELNRAVFSAGELWILQPYTDAEDNYIAAEYGEGQFNVRVWDSNFTMYGSSGTVCTTQTYTGDDSANNTVYLKTPGSIDARMCYLKYHNRTWNNALTDGGYDSDTDWAVAGQGVTLEAWISHDGSEGDNQGVAYDMLLKFDGDFFEPDGDAAANISITSTLSPTQRYFWAAKPDGTNWVDDEEMKSATEDDLVYYTSLEAVKAASAIPVGFLVEWRGVSPSAAGMNHYHVYVDGKIKTNDTAGKVYLFTRSTYAWNKSDVAAAAAEYCGTAAEELTDEQYTKYAREAFPSRGTSGITMLDGNKEFTGNYPKPFWRQDYHVSNGNGTIGTGTGNTLALQNCTKATYEADGYHPGRGAPYYQDSCLVVPFATTIGNTTAQQVTTNGVTTFKKVYDMSQNQCTVDYVLTPTIRRTGGDFDSTASALKVTVYVQDTLPANMTYIIGTSYLGGVYTADSKCQVPGTVANGTELQPTVVGNPDGTTTLTWEFEAEIDANVIEWLNEIHFSCTINNQAVAHQDQLDTTAVIWAAGEKQYGFKEEYGNKAIYGIEIEKMNATSLVKVADQLVVDWWEDMGFTMNVGNNSSNDKENTIIVETLPYNEVNHTSFHGDLVVSEFLAGATANPAESGEIIDKFTFYYTTDKNLAGCDSESLKALVAEAAKTNESYASNPNQYFADASEWTKLTVAERSIVIDNKPYHYFIDFPAQDKQPPQIVAIIAVGNLEAGKTLNMHITLKLTNGQKGDVLYNYLSQDGLTSYASTQVVSRALEGLTWNDSNGDGVQNFKQGEEDEEEGEEPISGIQVSLWKLKDRIPAASATERDYEQVCYPDRTTPVVIQTGQQTSVRAVLSQNLTGSQQYVDDYEPGHYKFMDLEAGHYMVKFESIDDGFQMAQYFASPVNQGGDDTIDSDGVPTYVESETRALENTVILGIDLSEDSHSISLMNGEYISSHNDSGFYWKSFELPETGGVGTKAYTLGGVVLLAVPLVAVPAAYSRRRRRFRRKDEAQ